MKRFLSCVGALLVLILLLPCLAGAQAPYINATAPLVYNVSGSISTWMLAADVFGGASGTAPNGSGVVYHLRYTLYAGCRYRFNYVVQFPNGGGSYNSHGTETQAFTQIGPQVTDPADILPGASYSCTSPSLSGAFGADSSTFFRSSHANVHQPMFDITYTLYGLEYSYQIKVELIHTSGTNIIVDAGSVSLENGWAHSLGSLSP